MNNTIKSLKLVPKHTHLFSSPRHCSITTAPRTPTFRFRQVTTLATEHPESMAQPQHDKDRDIDIEESGGPDLMSHSFGEGYATRADEEGFGGVYGANQATLDKKVHENHPAYDKSQGCEVKEKEKARNQKNAAS